MCTALFVLIVFHKTHYSLLANYSLETFSQIDSSLYNRPTCAVMEYQFTPTRAKTLRKPSSLTVFLNPSAGTHFDPLPLNQSSLRTSTTAPTMDTSVLYLQSIQPVKERTNVRAKDAGGRAKRQVPITTVPTSRYPPSVSQTISSQCTVEPTVSVSFVRQFL